MSSVAPVTMDDSLWPLVVARYVGTPTLAQFEEGLEKRAAFLRRDEPHLILVDAIRGDMLPAEHRQRQVEWMVQYEELIRQKLLGTAYVTDSALIRLTLSTIFYFKSPAYPYVIAPSLERGVEWLARKMDEAGLHEAATHSRNHFGLIRGRMSG